MMPPPDNIVLVQPTISPTPEEVHKTVRNMIALGSRLSFDKKVIEGQQNAPPPSGLYAAVTLIGDSSPVTASTRKIYRAVDEDYSVVEVDIQRDTYDSFDVQWMRRGALIAAKQTRVWLRDPIGQLFGKERDVEIIRIGQVRNLKDVFRSRWEEHAGFDMRIRYQEHIVTRVPRILKVRIAIQVAIATSGQQQPHYINIDARELARARHEGMEHIFVSSVDGAPIVGPENLPNPSWEYGRLDLSEGIRVGSETYYNRIPSDIVTRPFVIRFSRAIPKGTKLGTDMGVVAWIQEPAYRGEGQ